MKNVKEANVLRGTMNGQLFAHLVDTFGEDNVTVVGTKAFVFMREFGNNGTHIEFSAVVKDPDKFDLDALIDEAAEKSAAKAEREAKAAEKRLAKEAKAKEKEAAETAE